jgi:hypothetical protein
VAEAGLAGLELDDGVLGDLKAVSEDVHQQEHQDPDREHRQPDARARIHERKPADRQAEEDRETREGAEHCGFAE